MTLISLQRCKCMQPAVMVIITIRTAQALAHKSAGPLHDPPTQQQQPKYRAVLWYSTQVKPGMQTRLTHRAEALLGTASPPDAHHLVLQQLGGRHLGEEQALLPSARHSQHHTRLNGKSSTQQSNMSPGACISAMPACMHFCQGNWSPDAAPLQLASARCLFREGHSNLQHSHVLICPHSED